MATTVATLAAERWLDEVILSAAVVDVAGANIDESVALPAGFGDCAILSILAAVTSVATVVSSATGTFSGPGLRAAITSNDLSTLVDIVGVGQWYPTAGLAGAYTEVACNIDPDALTLWRQGELLRLKSPEIDVNAAPTGDWAVHVKVVRVRPIESPARGPIRLVR